jgi:hypothetical protein
MAVDVIHQDSVIAATAGKGESFRAAYVLSAMVAVLAAAACIAGLAYPEWYRDKNWGAAAFGNDLVTLVVAVPVLAGSMILSARGSVRARLVWLGALYFMLYNYAFYTFGMPVSELYVPLIVVFTLSAYALALAMGNLDVEAVGSRFRSRITAWLVAAWMVLWAFGVGRLWIGQWVRFLVNGTVPTVNGDANGYRFIAAVDLSFMVSLLIPAVWLLSRRRPWGYVLAVMLNVQGAMYTAVMAAVAFFGWRAAPGTKLWSGWFIGCIVSSIVCLLCLCGLLMNMGRTRAAR